MWNEFKLFKKSSDTQGSLTTYITWVDLSDAFKSVPHSLISHVLSHYNLPPQIISYIQDIYTKLKGRVETKDWESDDFSS